MADINNAVLWIIGIANDDAHGYDQINRWSPDYDCSSLVITALERAGFPVKSKFGATYTGNMRSALSNAGFTDVVGEVDLKTGKGLKVGDVLLKPYAHTEMVTGVNPVKLTGAHINENGRTTGGRRGDQTGKEISTIRYYNYPWKHVFRYMEKSVENVDKVARDVIDGKYGNGVTRMIRLRMAGYDYNTVQRRVNEILKEESKK